MRAQKTLFVSAAAMLLAIGLVSIWSFPTLGELPSMQVTGAEGMPTDALSAATQRTESGSVGMLASTN
jgi:hypothetical protein